MNAPSFVAVRGIAGGEITDCWFVVETRTGQVLCQAHGTAPEATARRIVGALDMSEPF